MVVQSTGERSGADGDSGLIPMYAVETYVKNGQVIGLGTGPAINELLKEISARLSDGRLCDVRCVPSSNVTASEAAFHGVPLLPANDCSHVHLMVDEADDIDTSDGNRISYIVGRGVNGPQAGQVSLRQLRRLLRAAETKIVLAHRGTAALERLKGQLPILINGNLETWEETAEEIDDIFLGDAEIKRRSYSLTANPRGGELPVVTDDGDMILDVDFYGSLKLFGDEASYEEIAAMIESVQGVITHGLVVAEADAAIVGLGNDCQSEIMHVGRGKALGEKV